MQTDELTDKLCLKCERAVENIYTFRQKCQKVQQELHHNVPLKELFLQKQFNQRKEGAHVYVYTVPVYSLTCV